MTSLALLILAFAVLGAAFTLGYLLCRWRENYGYVDVAWAYAFGAVALLYGWFGPGWSLRRIALASMVILWSVRLGSHLLRRVHRHHPAEDGRYVQLRHAWAAHFHARMFGFFQLQSLSVILLSAPFLLAMVNPDRRFHPLELAGVTLWFIALCGEALADAQLAAHQRAATSRGTVCTRGLWRYSRHPNYFFEWLIWLGFALFTLGSPWGGFALLAPATMLYLLFRVTGIPLNEAQSLRTKGEAYRRYQETTSVFLPLPRRSVRP